MGPSLSLRALATRVLTASAILALVVVVLLGIAELANVLLLFFGGVVLAALLRGVARQLHRVSRVPLGWALVLTVLLVVALLVGTGWLVAPRVFDQLAQLPTYWAEVRASTRQLLAQHTWLASGLSYIEQNVSLPSARGMASHALGAFSSLFSALGGLFLVLFVGLYLAAAPEHYLTPMLRLLPPRRRERVRAVLVETGHTLERWIVGRLLSMAIVGAGTAAGLGLLGFPIALSLGLIAATLSFIPNVGPVLSLVPALLLAVPRGLPDVLWVCGIYGTVQAIESFLITPKVQERAVHLPPAFLLLVQAVMAVLAGLVGLLLATPLIACLAKIVHELYVKDVLEHDEAGSSSQASAGSPCEE